MKNLNPKTNPLEHSEAKIKLYGRYLSVLLNILHRAKFERIFLFDLFCGEGLYENGVEGSPIIALNAIKNHYFSNQKSTPNMTVWFNDNGISEIEKNIYKIDRVQKLKRDIFTPKNVDIGFYKENFEDIYPRAIEEIKNARNSRALFFIDPFGYKSIKPEDIRKILESMNSEVLLWLPIAQMYRFADSAMLSDFPGSEPLRLFLTELFGNSIPSFQSPYEFIERLRNRFRAYLQDLGVFVDTFVLERDARNVYCLFFFTRNIRGYEKMLEAKWNVDPSRGKGHSTEKTISMFDEIELSGYPEKLLSFIKDVDYRTNKELYQFGLENCFLPKHTNKFMKEWKNTDKVEVISLDGNPVKGFYIEYGSERRVGFKLKVNVP